MADNNRMTSGLAMQTVAVKEASTPDYSDHPHKYAASICFGMTSSNCKGPTATRATTKFGFLTHRGLGAGTR